MARRMYSVRRTTRDVRRESFVTPEELRGRAEDVGQRLRFRPKHDDLLRANILNNDPTKAHF